MIKNALMQVAKMAAAILFLNSFTPHKLSDGADALFVRVEWVATRQRNAFIIAAKNGAPVVIRHNDRFNPLVCIPHAFVFQKNEISVG